MTKYFYKNPKKTGVPEPELIDFEGDFRVNMYRRTTGEFGVNVKATQTTQTHQITQHDVSQLSEDDKKVLSIIRQ